MKFYLSLFFPVLFACVCSCGDSVYEVSEDVLLDKVKGAWAAKMIGVEYGMPFEFAHCGEIYDGPIEWTPEMVEGALRQDDIYGQASFMMTFEKYGLDVPADTLAGNFAMAAFPLCHSNLQARKNWLDGIPASELSLPENNIHCEDLDFQIEADFIGIIHPAMFRSSGMMAEKVGSIMAHADGLYGGMFVAAMDAGAYYLDDMEEIILTALKTIPEESTYAECIRDVLDGWHTNPDDWKKTWHRLETKWGPNDVCTPYIPFNIDAKLNGAYIATALLYGGGYFEKTMEIAVRCGQDTDCNASSAATVLGIMNGWSSIPDRFKSHIGSISDRNFLYTDYSFSSLVENSMKFIEDNVVSTGGQVKDGIFRIRKQKPEPAELQEGFGGLRLAYMKTVADAGVWKFDDSWTDFSYNVPGDNAPYKVSTAPGASVTVEFDGTGFALLGSWNSDCGKAEIYVDGELVKVADTYFREEAGKYEGNRAYICHLTGLEKGRHEMKLSVSEEKNPKSSGYKVYIEKILVYE